MSSTAKRNAAVVGSVAVLTALGFGGTMAAQANTGDGAPPQTTVQTEQSDGDGELNDKAEEAQEGAEAEDGPDVGPDANPNEPGHQDADDGAEEEEGEAGAEEAEDGPDVGPDANPNEPGHQDADDGASH